METLRSYKMPMLMDDEVDLPGRARRRKFPKPERWSLRRARELYERGATFDQLAARFWLAPQTVRKRLVASGMQPRPRGWRIPVKCTEEKPLQVDEGSGHPKPHEP